MGVGWWEETSLGFNAQWAGSPSFQVQAHAFEESLGRCFRCLESDHRIAFCRNPAKCLLCGDIGHKARSCLKNQQSQQREEQPRGTVQAAAQLQIQPQEAASQVQVTSSPPAPVGMEAPGGNRRSFVKAMAPRSATVANAETLLLRHAVVAVVELFEVKRGFALHFGIAEEAVRVMVHAQGEFLLRFMDPEVRKTALRIQGALRLGQVSFLLSPWSRLRRATASSLPFKARVCLEGVPDHAWDVESVKPLFGEALIDSVDELEFSEKDTACFRLWVWMENVDNLATSGVLKLEEPLEVEPPLIYFPEFGVIADALTRTWPIKMVDHPVLIHLDKVIDHNGRPADSSVSSSSEGTVTWGNRWVLGMEDVIFSPPQPRASVHTRLQFPRRDGGDGAAGGRRGGGGGGGASGGRRGGGAERQTGWDQPPRSEGSSERSFGGDGGGGGRQRSSEVLTVLGGSSGAQRMQDSSGGHVIEPGLTGEFGAAALRSAEVVGGSACPSRESLGDGATDSALASTDKSPADLSLVPLYKETCQGAGQAVDPLLAPLVDLLTGSMEDARGTSDMEVQGLIGLIVDIQAMEAGLQKKVHAAGIGPPDDVPGCPSPVSDPGSPRGDAP
ncbi:hypothetical protein ACQ4PT_007923 [Festuca glaucescens]